MEPMNVFVTIIGTTATHAIVEYNDDHYIVELEMITLDPRNINQLDYRLLTQATIVNYE